MRTARKNDHIEKLMRDSVFIYGRLYVSPSLPQDDSDQAENTEHMTDYASVTKAGIYTRTVREHAAVEHQTKHRAA